MAAVYLATDVQHNRRVAVNVMPFVDGESLRDRMTREGPLPLGDALRLTAERRYERERLYRLLAILFTDRGDELARIISARCVTPRERRTHENDFR